MSQEERREQEKRKQEAPIKIPQGAKEKKPSVKVHPQPEQKPQTEEEAFMSYMNTLISNAVLDNEAIKTKQVEVIKSLGQQLGIYMREVSRLKEELAKKNNPKKPETDPEVKKPEK